MNHGDDELYRRVIASTAANAHSGRVRWAPGKSLWWFGMLLGWAVLGSLYFSWGAVLAFLATAGATLCLGHSLGMHRKLIHQGFACPLWLEMILVYLGTLVGLGGPFTMMRTHDLRDWAQRQPKCHDFFSHGRGILTDWWWQLHCDLILRHPPDYRHPDRVARNRFYQFIEKTFMWQQLPLALVLYQIGGIGWVAWAVCGRVTVSIFGHWLIGYFAHNRGHRDWHVQGAAVQGHNVRFCGLITFGECWHNNHHAFPGSAKLGLYPGQCDPGWHVLQLLGFLGLATDFRTPEDLPDRAELSRI